MKPIPSLVLVDFDDTLVNTAPRFRQARERLFERLVQLGLELEAMHRLHHDVVDPEMLVAHGLGPARLPHSFGETYRRACALHGLPHNDQVLRECMALAQGVAGAPPPLPGALDALRALAARLPAVVYTQSGDPPYQLRCIREVGVFSILPEQRVHICSRKTTEEFHATLRRFGDPDPATVWMIGNSMRADINPALEAGANAILVEAEVWEGDHADPVADHFTRAPDFRTAVRLLLDQSHAR
jgi:putative hydrolase of the HAD superfamily